MHKKLRQGATQGAKLLRALWQARNIAAFLAFSRDSSHSTQIEQTLRRRLLYPAELWQRVSFTRIFYHSAPLLSRGTLWLFCYLPRRRSFFTPPSIGFALIAKIAITPTVCTAHQSGSSSTINAVCTAIIAVFAISFGV